MSTTLLALMVDGIWCRGISRGEDLWGSSSQELLSMFRKTGNKWINKWEKQLLVVSPMQRSNLEVKQRDKRERCGHRTLLCAWPSAEMEEEFQAKALDWQQRECQHCFYHKATLWGWDFNTNMGVGSRQFHPWQEVLKKNCKESIKHFRRSCTHFSYYSHLQLIWCICHNKWRNIDTSLVTHIHPLFGFPSFLPNVIFQDPIQGTTVHLVINSH